MGRKKKVVKVDFKPIIIDALLVMANQANKDRNTFKNRAYIKVVGQLKNFDKPIYTIEDIEGIEGIYLLSFVDS